MSAVSAAHLALGLMLVVCVYAGWQLLLRDLDLLMRLGLAANLFGSGVLWLRANKPVEGRTLVLLSYDHGLTVADTAVLLPGALLVLVLWRQAGPVSALLKRR